MYKRQAIISGLGEANIPDLIDAFKRELIDARVFFWPLSTLDFFDDANAPQALRLSRFGLNLPTPHGLSHFDVRRVCSVLHEYIMACRASEGVIL